MSCFLLRLFPGEELLVLRIIHYGGRHCRMLSTGGWPHRLIRWGLSSLAPVDLLTLKLRALLRPDVHVVLLVWLWSSRCCSLWSADCSRLRPLLDRSLRIALWRLRWRGAVDRLFWAGGRHGHSRHSLFGGLVFPEEPREPTINVVRSA